MLLVKIEEWADGTPWRTDFFLHPDPEVLEVFAKKASGLADSYWGICGEESSMESITLDGSTTDLSDPTWIWTSLES